MAVLACGRQGGYHPAPRATLYPRHRSLSNPGGRSCKARGQWEANVHTVLVTAHLLALRGCGIIELRRKAGTIASPHPSSAAAAPFPYRSPPSHPRGEPRRAAVRLAATGRPSSSHPLPATCLGVVVLALISPWPPPTHRPPTLAATRPPARTSGQRGARWSQRAHCDIGAFALERVAVCTPVIARWPVSPAP